MKAKIKDIKSNPFKQRVNKGKLNQGQINKLKNSIEAVGFTGSVPVMEIKGKYHLISHHHRLEALKQLYGNEYEVIVQEKPYNEEKLLREMVNENLTQRNGEFREEIMNLVAVREYLQKGSDSDLISKTTTKKFVAGSQEHITRWLNKHGEILPKTHIQELLSMYDNLDKTIYENIESPPAGKHRDSKTLSKTQGIRLASFKDKQEQKDLAKAMRNSKEQRVRKQGKLLTKYKNVPQKAKDLVRSGEYDLADIDDLITMVDNPTDKTVIVKSSDEYFVEMLQSELEPLEKIDVDYLVNMKDKTLQARCIEVIKFAHSGLADIIRKVEKTEIIDIGR